MVVSIYPLGRGDFDGVLELERHLPLEQRASIGLLESRSSEFEEGMFGAWSGKVLLGYSVSNRFSTPVPGMDVQNDSMLRHDGEGNMLYFAQLADPRLPPLVQNGAMELLSSAQRELAQRLNLDQAILSHYTPGYLLRHSQQLTVL